MCSGMCSGFKLYADIGPECICQTSGRDELAGEVKLVTDAEIEGRHWLRASVWVCHSTSSAGSISTLFESGRGLAMALRQRNAA